MRSDVVVPVTEYVEVLVKRAKQAFDPSVLPGTAGRGALMADAKLFQTPSKGLAGEDGFVIGADGLGFAVGVDGFSQTGKYGLRCFAVQGLQVQ